MKQQGKPGGAHGGCGPDLNESLGEAVRRIKSFPERGCAWRAGEKWLDGVAASCVASVSLRDFPDLGPFPDRGGRGLDGLRPK
jgi:hypothetical protein